MKIDTTALDSGLIQICDLINSASVGNKPNYQLSQIVQCYFGEQSLSYSRQYLAMGANRQIDMVVRILNVGIRPKIGQFAILTFYDGQINESGDQFRIDNVQTVIDEDGLKAYDLTLSSLGDFYDVA